MQTPSILRHHGGSAANYRHNGVTPANYRPSPQFRRDPPPNQAARFHPQPRPASRPAFTLLLLRGSRPGISFRDLESLITGCPTAPDEFFTDRLGPVAARLLYRQWHHILDALAFFWRRRLNGAHLLLPRIESSPYVPSDKVEEYALIRTLFVSHLNKLLDSDPVRRCHSRIEHMEDEIQNITLQLRKKKNSLQFYLEMKARREKLGEDKQQLEARLAEFQASVRCILKHIGEKQDEVEASYEYSVEPFKFGGSTGVIDWGLIHHVMVRECRRLDDGLPIYSCRRKILKEFLFNQVFYD